MGSTGRLQISQDEEIDMEDDLNQAMNDAIASSTFATATSTRVTNSVTDLKPDILAILDKLVDNGVFTCFSNIACYCGLDV
ncbi:hypothetical protein ASPTUDRAFT_41817 [Aspergillus tubingensis CBS 134.48]|uniref:Uncharacterized protein n=1 Tax=Aspergillus tubingensis (strain CBS 134.48) TaxID=767770 RepID=A0A1L9N8J2_ASPTC|nr:hypothetical protein ASPTUDRAFT_41817 [Aspergillus tubingensis CBS 134.48]